MTAQMSIDLTSPDARWNQIAAGLKVINLSFPVQLVIPSLIVPTFSRSTRGVSLFPGRAGFAIGFLLIVMTFLIALILGGEAGLAAGVISFWLIGTAGIAMMAGAFLPLAFVKPICVRCRLLPVIKEHEAIHLAGVLNEKDVWASMRTRHSVQSLSLEGDPAICWFCPIPKRLSEH